MAMPKRGLNPSRICSSLVSETILENVAEKAIPINIKFKTGRGNTSVLKINPTPEATIIIVNSSISVIALLRSFFKTTPAARPVTTPMSKGKKTTMTIIYPGRSPAERLPATIAIVVKKQYNLQYHPEPPLELMFL